LPERFESLTQVEREQNDRAYSERMLDAALAVWALGEIGDPSVIPLLEPLRDIRHLQMEWIGNPVDRSIQRIRARHSTANPPAHPDPATGAD